MKTSKAVLGVLVVGFVGCFVSGIAVHGKSSTYKQDANGLEKQFEPFLKACHKADVPGQKEAFKLFQFPDAKGWFGQYFEPEVVQQLAWDAEAEAEGQGRTLAMMMNMMNRGGRFHVHCKPHARGETQPLKERQSSVRPIKAVPIEQFDIEFQAENGKRFSFLGNFVYAQGAYRYVGKGALPFWTMPDANDPAKSQ